MPRFARPLCCIFLFLSLSILTTHYFVYIRYRPNYAAYTILAAQEAHESQRLISNSREAKYVKFRQLQGAGFNNQAQEILLFHHLALSTSRVYVYQPFVWRPRGEHAHVPLSAFMAGVTRGSLSSALFDLACPESEVTHLQLDVPYETRWSNAVAALNGNDKCIVVDAWIMNWDFLESPGVMSIWPTFKAYLGNHFEWSKEVLNIVERTQDTLGLRISPHANIKNSSDYFAVHLRRGDFEEHCQHLSDKKKGFTTWATLPVLHPSIFPPVLDPTNASSIIEHCYPPLRRILDALTILVQRHPQVRTLHVMHDGAWDHPLVYMQYHKLATAVTSVKWARAHGWMRGPMLRVSHSGEVPVMPGEADWAVCVDVELGRRAKAFLGNGYSSLSSQVAALRLGDGGAPEDIGFI